MKKKKATLAALHLARGERRTSVPREVPGLPGGHRAPGGPLLRGRIRAPGRDSRGRMLRADLTRRYAGHHTDLEQGGDAARGPLQMQPFCEWRSILNALWAGCWARGKDVLAGELELGLLRSRLLLPGSRASFLPSPLPSLPPDAGAAPAVYVTPGGVRATSDTIPCCLEKGTIVSIINQSCLLSPPPSCGVPRAAVVQEGPT